MLSTFTLMHLITSAAELADALYIQMHSADDDSPNTPPRATTFMACGAAATMPAANCLAVRIRELNASAYSSRTHCSRLLTHCSPRSCTHQPSLLVRC